MDFTDPKFGRVVDAMSDIWENPSLRSKLAKLSPAAQANFFSSVTKLYDKESVDRLQKLLHSRNEFQQLGDDIVKNTLHLRREQTKASSARKSSKRRSRKLSSESGISGDTEILYQASKEKDEPDTDSSDSESGTCDLRFRKGPWNDPWNKKTTLQKYDSESDSDQESSIVDPADDIQRRKYEQTNSSESDSDDDSDTEDQNAVNRTNQKKQAIQNTYTSGSESDDNDESKERHLGNHKTSAHMQADDEPSKDMDKMESSDQEDDAFFDQVQIHDGASKQTTGNKMSNVACVDDKAINDSPDGKAHTNETDNTGSKHICIHNDCEIIDESDICKHNGCVCENTQVEHKPGNVESALIPDCQVSADESDCESSIDQFHCEDTQTGSTVANDLKRKKSNNQSTKHDGDTGVGSVVLGKKIKSKKPLAGDLTTVKKATRKGGIDSRATGSKAKSSSLEKHKGYVGSKGESRNVPNQPKSKKRKPTKQEVELLERYGQNQKKAKKTGATKQSKHVTNKNGLRNGKSVSSESTGSMDLSESVRCLDSLDNESEVNEKEKVGTRPSARHRKYSGSVKYIERVKTLDSLSKNRHKTAKLKRRKITNLGDDTSTDEGNANTNISHTSVVFPVITRDNQTSSEDTDTTEHDGSEHSHTQTIYTREIQFNNETAIESNYHKIYTSKKGGKPRATTVCTTNTDDVTRKLAGVEIKRRAKTAGTFETTESSPECELAQSWSKGQYIPIKQMGTTFEPFHDFREEFLPKPMKLPEYLSSPSYSQMSSAEKRHLVGSAQVEIQQAMKEFHGGNTSVKNLGHKINQFPSIRVAESYTVIKLVRNDDEAERSNSSTPLPPLHMTPGDVDFFYRSLLRQNLRKKIKDS